MEAVIDRDNVNQAKKAIRSNQGSAGIDGRTIEQTEVHLRQHWRQIEDKLVAGTYVPSPIRGVEIPKANGGKRRLGIPTVQDRIIQQAIVQVLSARIDASFSAHSYGYRPGRSAHDAVKAAQSYIREGKCWVVDVDISAFFDEVNHDILMHRVGQVSRDKRLLRLIGRYLRADRDEWSRSETQQRHAAGWAAESVARQRVLRPARQGTGATWIELLPLCG